MIAARLSRRQLSALPADLFKLIDGFKTCMMTTHRKDLGPVGRSMSVAKRDGANLLFLANKHSRKFFDLENSKQVQVTFQDNSKQNWISLTGEAVTISNEDARIKDLTNKMVSAWFGDLGDGVHTGKAEDPRMTLIEIKPKYVIYYQTEVSKMGMMKEVGQAAMTGKVAQTGVVRELYEADLTQGGMKGSS